MVDPLGILRPYTKLTHQLPLVTISFFENSKLRTFVGLSCGSLISDLWFQVSAYSAFVRPGMGLGLEQHRRRVDLNTNEPLFTNCTRDFIGTHDYIFYTGITIFTSFSFNYIRNNILLSLFPADTLTVESLLELLDEDGLRKDTALPSPEWSSNHIALLAEFRCMPRPRR